MRTDSVGHMDLHTQVGYTVDTEIAHLLIDNVFSHLPSHLLSHLLSHTLSECQSLNLNLLTTLGLESLLPFVGLELNRALEVGLACK
jgi:hypothetical protein